MTWIPAIIIWFFALLVNIASDWVEEGKWDERLKYAATVSNVLSFVVLCWSLYADFKEDKRIEFLGLRLQTITQRADSLGYELSVAEEQLKDNLRSMKYLNSTADSLEKKTLLQRKQVRRLRDSSAAMSQMVDKLSLQQSNLTEHAESLQRRTGVLKKNLESRASIVQIMTVIASSSGGLTSSGPKTFTELNPRMRKVKNEAAFVESGLSPMYDPMLRPSSSGNAINLCHLRMRQADERLKWAAIAMAKKMHMSTEKFSSPRLLLFEPCEDSRHFGQSGLSPLSIIHSLYLYSDVPVLKRIVAGDAKGAEFGFIIRVNDKLTYYQMQDNLNVALNESMQYASDRVARQKSKKNCLDSYDGDEKDLSTRERDRVLKECGIDEWDTMEEVDKQQHMVKLSTDTSAVVVPLRKFDRIEVSVDSLSQLATLPSSQETDFDQVWALSGRSLTSPQRRMWDLRRSFMLRGSKKDIGVDPTKISYFEIGEGPHYATKNERA